MAIYIPKPSKELLKALEEAGVMKPEPQQQPQQQQPQQQQGDLIMQLAKQTGLSEELVVSVLEVMLKRAKGKPIVPAVPVIPNAYNAPASNYNETLTVGLAAGLDVPTAMVLAEDSKYVLAKGRWWVETWALIVIVVVSFVWLLLRYLGDK